MGRLRRGFTMVELLVVIAITVVLMGLLMGPLSQSFQLTNRGRTMIAAQDNARTAMAQITRELQDAMVVYDGLPIYMYGYTEMPEFRGRPHPESDARPSVILDPRTIQSQNPQPIQFRDAMLDLVLPRARYYCTGFNHYLSDNEVAPNQAIEDCPRTGHQNSPVQSRPIQPLQPSGTRVRYFVALRQGYPPDPADPTVPGGNSLLPRYMNPLLFTQSGSDYNNPYVLYRAEFDPNSAAAPATANWLMQNGQVNPNFFYDQNFSRNWKVRSVAVISPQNTDMVRWVRDRDPVQDRDIWMPQPMTRFAATPVDSETLDPNKESIIPDGAGGYVEGQVPMQYVADYGHWTGPINDMTLPLPPGVLIGPTLPPAVPPLFALGPRFQVFEVQRGPGGTVMTPVYDSAVPVAQVPRRRLFTWDSSRGIVNFALRAETTLAVNATGGGAPDEVPFSLSLKRHRQTLDLPVVTQLSQSVNLPAGFGSLLADPLLGPTVRIVPGSEVVQVRDNSGQPVRTFERAGWLGTARDQVTAQPDLELDQYVIDYSNGLIMFSDRDPSLANLPVHVRYQMHTNKATDLVRVSYSTRELMTLSVGLLQYEAGTGEAQEIQLTNRLRLRNLSR